MRKDTIIKDKTYLRFLVSVLMCELVTVLVFSFMPVESPATAEADEITYPYTQTFTISAYYSPLPDQAYYYMGSYDAEIRMNGSGVNGADGTPVYPGMIAAPSNYEFGTKMYISGIGMVAVHDRGGAIVNAGQRNQNYDRLDVWMGYGDEGLERALNWGKRDIEVTVYGVDDTISEDTYLEGYAETERIVQNVIFPTQLFSSDLWYGTQNDDVQKLQEYLAILGYYNDDITGYYGDDTWQAVFDFQVDQEIVDDSWDFGAGHFGISTRRSIDKALADVEIEKELEQIDFLKEGLAKIQQYTDLSEDPVYFTNSLALGSSGEDVYSLQVELQNLGYFLIEPTGYYGEVTQHAVFKLQQKLGLVTTMEDEGAGVAGPKTRSTINEIVGDRIDTKIYVAEGRAGDAYLAQD
ncbi:hypothetical protein COW94_03585 [Candidatus Peregrinibacteria bacterium CG22_combo_CG10-13_8_21_14_all_44_10]|nr:MAG: hypothetical protein AUK45_04565 [Candidatus Peregrinibacteria bacterium CG2_30_44_17]PIP66098.1 MAG: hypothetical protein COW94_03585 [Candidatus Peregrinibacteria bacterium CG22_combo_CG10-13_8_21_14_all_44_10]PIS04243.1 MAG: hypothetical protein COT83_01640 [Candidatus Peregrinibacteria bacterium CG10_big_fil_rev_8_21_14_0_10_44_7]PIX78929.1 MAG: hypothetical protein COZ35_04415 [Candidatus Peregrinibacteria bacterium CG_4_10_14_3_um_filter_44_21]PJB89419.1 MAG: hypothetical protein 